MVTISICRKYSGRGTFTGHSLTMTPRGRAKKKKKKKKKKKNNNNKKKHDKLDTSHRPTKAKPQLTFSQHGEHSARQKIIVEIYRNPDIVAILTIKTNGRGHYCTCSTWLVHFSFLFFFFLNLFMYRRLASPVNL